MNERSSLQPGTLHRRARRRLIRQTVPGAQTCTFTDTCSEFFVSTFRATMALSPFKDYSLGQVLSLNVIRNHDQASAVVMHARVRRLHTRTMSCTMVVDLVDKDRVLQKDGTAFLKLFDRRFSDTARNFSGVKPWTEDIEQAYIDWVQSGTIVPFLHNLRYVADFLEETGDDWNDAEGDAYMADKMHGMFKKELAAYEALTEHQGSLIPKLLAAVDLDISTPESTDAHLIVEI